ncbi:MAG: hypothetical protein ACYC46_00470 [Acidobacteriaceae bacterium]
MGSVFDVSHCGQQLSTWSILAFGTCLHFRSTSFCCHDDMDIDIDRSEDILSVPATTGSRASAGGAGTGDGDSPGASIGIKTTLHSGMMVCTERLHVSVKNCP